MKSNSDTGNPNDNIGKQAALVYAGEYWFPLSAAAKTLVCMLEEQKYLEPRGNNVYVGRVTDPKPDTSTQMDLLHISV